MIDIKVDNKYRFIHTPDSDGVVVERYGEPHVCFKEGENAILALIGEIEELKTQLKTSMYFEERFRGALTRIASAMKMPGSPSLVDDVPRAVERVAARCTIEPEFDDMRKYVGPCVKGPAKQGVVVRSFQEFVDVFGEYECSEEIPESVKGFFSHSQGKDGDK